MKALIGQGFSHLFGAPRGFISRVKVDNHRLPFEFGEGQSLSILIFQSEGWWRLSFVYLKTPEITNQSTNECYKAHSFHCGAKCTLAKMVFFTEEEEDGIEREVEWENLRP
jgi:hypothetical protein